MGNASMTLLFSCLLFRIVLFCTQHYTSETALKLILLVSDLHTKWMFSLKPNWNWFQFWQIEYAINIYYTQFGSMQHKDDSVRESIKSVARCEYEQFIMQ